MNYETSTLANGIRVVTSAMPHTRSAAVQIYLGVGARQEAPEISGISHFIEHMVFKGTERRPHPVQISEAIEGVGGMLDAATDHEHTNYRALVPSAHFATALDVLTDMLRNARFAPSDIKKERAVIIEEINATYDSPPEIADYEFDELMWGGHPLGRDVAGTRQSVRRIKRPDLIAHVEKHYRPEAIVISVAGNVTHEGVLKEVERLWGDVAHSGQVADFPAGHEAPVAQPGPRISTFKKQTEQSNLLVGVPALPYTDPARYTQDMLDGLLGGGMSSRLFVAIREDLGLAYSVSSFLKTFSDAGAFGVYAAVDNDHVKDTLGAIMDELDKIRQAPVPEVELRKVKEYIKGHTVLSLERSSYVAHWAGWQELMLGRIDSVDEVLERVEAVSAEDVLALARRLFSTEKLHLAIVGPLNGTAAFRRVLKLA
jgi:predicted Zn-dependent peptidase